MGISGGVGKQGAGDAREVVAELQAACSLLAVAADLYGNVRVMKSLLMDNACQGCGKYSLLRGQTAPPR